VQIEGMPINVKTALTRLYEAQNIQEEEFTLKFKDLEVYGVSRLGEEPVFDLLGHIKFYPKDLQLLIDLIRSRT
jgi:hypothetical protein